MNLKIFVFLLILLLLVVNIAYSDFGNLRPRHGFEESGRGETSERVGDAYAAALAPKPESSLEVGAIPNATPLMFISGGEPLSHELFPSVRVNTEPGLNRPDHTFILGAFRASPPFISTVVINSLKFSERYIPPEIQDQIRRNLALILKGK